MERIGQTDVATILGRLHQELKSQTRDSKLDQHQLLRKAFQYVTATLHKPASLLGPGHGHTQGRKLSEVTHRVLQELFALLVGGDGFAPPRIRILSFALVRELSAGETPYFFRDNYGGDFQQYDQNKVSYFLPVLSQLSNVDLLVKNIPNLVAWFTSDSSALALKTVAISNLLAAVQRFPNVLDKDLHIRPMEEKFKSILTSASLESRKTTSTTLFGVKIVSTSTSCHVTEVDGTPTRDFFTCMNNSFDYSEDQILNVHVFSSLYSWLFHLYQGQLLDARKRQSRDDIVSKLEHFGLVHDGVGLSGEAKTKATEGPVSLEEQRRSPIGSFTLDDSFRQVMISVSLRILSQVEYDIVREGNQQMRLGSKYMISELDWMREFTEAVSMEAVRILDLLCLMDPSLVTNIFPAVKKVYERTAGRQSGVVFAAVLQFFVNHGQHVIFDVDPVLHHFFEDYVSVRYRQQLLAMSTLLFLTTNTSKMLLHTPVFPKYYPAIIKLLAWHPRTLAVEVLPVLPAMVGPASFAELFHTLLDLPLTAAFMEQYDRPEETHVDSHMTRLGLDRMSPAFKIVHQYIMRNQAGLGGVCIWETRDEAQMSMIRILWNSLPVTPRVSSVCKLVPRFLRVYFDVLLTNAPPECIERVVPLLLQRFASLYPVDFFLNSVHTLIIDTLQAIFQQWPHFLISLKREVVHAISTHLDVQGRVLVLHLCWIIGELLRPSVCSNRADIATFFEALETLAYQAISSRASPGGAREGGGRGEAETTLSGTASTKPGESRWEGGELERTNSMRSRATESSDFHEESGAGSGVGPPTGGEDGRDDGLDLGGKVASGEAVFTPRFVAVIIASLTKLGTKFPEFAPRVVLCLMKMQHNYETDFGEGIEFVRDRLIDSLQLLRHSAITSSVYSSQYLPGVEPDRFLSFHLSALSSLGHLSHDPSAYTPGAALHDFELPTQPPSFLVSSGPHVAAPWVSQPAAAGGWWEALPISDSTQVEAPTSVGDPLDRGASSSAASPTKALTPAARPAVSAVAARPGDPLVAVTQTAPLPSEDLRAVQGVAPAEAPLAPSLPPAEAAPPLKEEEPPLAARTDSSAPQAARRGEEQRQEASSPAEAASEQSSPTKTIATRSEGTSSSASMPTSPGQAVDGQAELEKEAEAVAGSGWRGDAEPFSSFSPAPRVPGSNSVSADAVSSSGPPGPKAVLDPVGLDHGLLGKPPNLPGEERAVLSASEEQASAPTCSGEPRLTEEAA